MLDAIFAFGAFVVQAVVETAVYTVVREAANYIKSKFVKNSQDNRSNASSSQDLSEKAQIDLNNINEEMIYYEKKAYRDGGLSSSDRDEFYSLKQKRERIYQRYRDLETYKTFNDVTTHSSQYDSVVIDNNHLHILQYYTGQIILDKKCPQCGRPMLLKHQTKTNVRLNDFFWGCTGYFEDQCRNTMNFNQSDLNLVYQNHITELKMSNDEFDKLFWSREKQIIKRSRDHLNYEDSKIVCPIHYTPMVLREKIRNNGTLLDRFYLRCSHYNCNQTVKLKSAAQIVSYLQRNEGYGLVNNSSSLILPRQNDALIQQIKHSLIFATNTESLEQLRIQHNELVDQAWTLLNREQKQKIHDLFTDPIPF